MAISDLITKIDTKIEAVLDADPAAYVDYRIGDKSVSKSQYLDFLLEARKKLCDQAAKSELDIGHMEFDFNVSEFGEDDGEYIT